MPARLKTRCRHPGCPRTTRDGFCGEHQREAYHRTADRRRGTSAQRGYDQAWRRLRQAYFAAHPLCEDCQDEGILTWNHIEVDHIIPIDVRPDLRLDMDNLRSRCRRHHQRKTLEDKRKYGNATVATEC